MIPQTNYFAYCKCRRCNETFKMDFPKKYVDTFTDRREISTLCIRCNSDPTVSNENPTEVMPDIKPGIADVTSIIKEEVIWYPYMQRYV